MTSITEFNQNAVRLTYKNWVINFGFTIISMDRHTSFYSSRVLTSGSQSSWGTEKCSSSYTTQWFKRTRLSPVLHSLSWCWRRGGCCNRPIRVRVESPLLVLTFECSSKESTLSMTNAISNGRKEDTRKEIIARIDRFQNKHRLLLFHCINVGALEREKKFFLATKVTLFFNIPSLCMYMYSQNVAAPYSPTSIFLLCFFRSLKLPCWMKRWRKAIHLANDYYTVTQYSVNSCPVHLQPI